jgi:superoxide dismutase, Fe-Mn family
MAIDHPHESGPAADSHQTKGNVLDRQRSKRRNFLCRSTLLASALSAAILPRSATAQSPVVIPGPVDVDHSPLLEQPRLPFAEDALAPWISAETLRFHYGKHHKGYFINLAKLTAGSPLAALSLEEVVIASSRDPAQSTLFDNAAQAWNHSFYWKSLSAKEQQPRGRLREAIERDFGSLDGMLAELAKTCIAQFGSGWGWLELDHGKLKITRTTNADLPFIHGRRPLLTIDVWEHAYYPDYQNRRPDYVHAVLKRLLNWSFAEENFLRG